MKKTTRNFKRISIYLNNNEGSTMVETLVSFVVLSIVLVALFAMVKFSSNLRMRAVDTADVRNEFNLELYKTTPDPDVVETYSYLGKSQDDMTMFMLRLSDETDDYNLLLGGSATPKSNFEKNVKIPNLDAVGYVSKNPRISQEKLATPKALMFMYHEFSAP
jgi:hypothetical protein